jgi:ATP-dependent Clp protease ATP-binding subunit ClpX
MWIDSPLETQGDTMPEPEQPQGARDAYCSFCRLSHRDVGPLAEGPGLVFICYACVQLCAAIIEQECERTGKPLKTEHGTTP